MCFRSFDSCGRGVPFVILGFPAENGSESLTYQVATLLETVRIAFTQSRPRHANDNARAESKNGAVGWQHGGDAQIAQPYATQVNAVCADVNPYARRRGFQAIGAAHRKQA
jgi:hypothetical protein